MPLAAQSPYDGLEGEVGCVLRQDFNNILDLSQDLLRESREQVITLLLFNIHMLEPDFALGVEKPCLWSCFPERRQFHVSSMLLWLLLLQLVCHIAQAGSPIVEIF
jgi:hypothetical protein